MERSTRYWDGAKDSLVLLANTLWDKLVPESGEADTEHGEAIRAGGRINYDCGNNGAGNMSRDMCGDMFSGFADTLLDLEKRYHVIYTPEEREFLNDVQCGDVEAIMEQWEAGVFDSLYDKVVLWAAQRAREPRPPVVGEGATYSVGSDRYAGTIIEVSKSGSKVQVRDDDARVVSGSGHDGSAVWKFKRNPRGRVQTFTRRRNGRYVLVGAPMRGGYGGVSFGYRDRYYDPHF